MKNGGTEKKIDLFKKIWKRSNLIELFVSMYIFFNLIKLYFTFN